MAKGKTKIQKKRHAENSRIALIFEGKEGLAKKNKRKSKKQKSKDVIVMYESYFLDCMVHMYIQGISHFLLYVSFESDDKIEMNIVPLPPHLSVVEGDIVGNRTVYSVAKTIGRILRSWFL